MIKTEMINNKVEPFDFVTHWSKFGVPLRGYSFSFRTLRTSRIKPVVTLDNSDTVTVEESLVSFLPQYTLFYGTVLHEAGIGRKKISYNDNLAQILQMALKQELMEQYSTRITCKVRVEDLPKKRAVAVYITKEVAPNIIMKSTEEEYAILGNILKKILEVNL
jgi:hypothetical protein